MNQISNNPRPSSPISREHRERLNGHRSAVLWLTGFSGAGKTTLAKAVEQHLIAKGVRAMVMDGDQLRTGLCNDLGFSAEARSENIRRVGEVSKLFCNAGIVVIAALISPMRKDRQRVRDLFAEGDFFEVFCNSSLQSCEQRDVKGLYRRARVGEIPEFTGISSPYEVPESPELTLYTDKDSVEECVQRLLAFIEGKIAFDSPSALL
jgi:adenylylsulfate kinase